MASSASSSTGHQSIHSRHDSLSPGLAGPSPDPDDVPLEVLVEHLLHARRSLSSIAHVARAHELVTHSRQLYEEAVVLSAQTTFLRSSINDQITLLNRVRKALLRTYDWSKTDFDQVIKQLDASGERLQKSMEMLRQTPVDPVFRPAGEEQKTLVDFIDEIAVDNGTNAVKNHIMELQAIRTSFDGDLLQFETDLRSLNKGLTLASPEDSTTDYPPIPDLLASLTSQAQYMAEDLAMLTQHFDMCVTAVRSTEGGAAMARRKAADMTHSQTGAGDLVSISGVMQPHDGSSSQSELDPTSSEDRAEAIAVVVQDASQVDEVVAALQEGLAQMEVDFASLSSQADRIRTAYTRAVASFAALEEVGQRLRGYVAAEGEFLERWGAEKDAVLTRLEEMDALQLFYDKYLSAYDSLLFEMERRKAVEDKIQSILRKARDNVQKLVEADHRERDAFRQDIGDYVPTDLWAHWNRPLPTWHIVSVDDGGETQDRTDASGLETDRGGSSVRR